MAALGRMPPKPHDEMKIGRNPKAEKVASPEKTPTPGKIAKATIGDPLAAISLWR
ncbi:MAG: hypothetical protein QOD94_2105 [Alphaproteobacteria bacterium]|jgi:hypothetical protein|nr:hypothetical protein [Alphaproteobacteria bacterium]